MSQEVGIEDLALPSTELMQRVRRVKSRLQFSLREYATGKTDALNKEGLDEESAELLGHFYSGLIGILQCDPVARLAYENAHFEYFLERKTEVENDWEMEIPDF
jgi:hypothetical protein